MNEKEIAPVNTKLYDECPACGRNGLAIADAHLPARRKCRLCYREAPKGRDRTLYLACECGLEGGPEKGYYLGGWWSVEPFFERKAAQTHLEASVARHVASHNRAAEYIRGGQLENDAKPMTVSRHPGVTLWRNGGARFYFIDEKLIDCTILAKDG